MFRRMTSIGTLFTLSWLLTSCVAPSGSSPNEVGRDGAPEILEPLSQKALHFRLELGAKPGRIVTGWLDIRAEGGKSFDSAVLDLDGDGRAETIQTFPEVEDLRTKSMVPHPRIHLPHDGADWLLDFRFCRFEPAGDTARRTWFDWSITQEGDSIDFQCREARFHTTAKAAAAVEPIKLGPPFRFEPGTYLQGPNVVLDVGFKIAGASVLKKSRPGCAPLRMQVALARDGAPIFNDFAAFNR